MATKAQKAISETETRLRKRAEDRFQKDWEELREFISRHPIGNKLIFKGENNEDVYLSKPNHTPKHVLITWNPDTIAGKSNIEKIKEDLVTKYEREETNELFNKLESVRYLFEQGGQY